MAVKFSEETLRNTPAVRAAIEICEFVAPDTFNITRTVSEIIQIAKKALRENTNTNAGAKVAAAMLIEKFCRNGNGQEMNKKVIELIRKNSTELMNPWRKNQ